MYKGSKTQNRTPKTPKTGKDSHTCVPKKRKKQQTWCAENGKALPKCVPKKGKQRARVSDRSFPFRAFIEGPFELSQAVSKLYSVSLAVPTWARECKPKSTAETTAGPALQRHGEFAHRFSCSDRAACLVLSKRLLWRAGAEVSLVVPTDGAPRTRRQSL